MLRQVPEPGGRDHPADGSAPTAAGADITADPTVRPPSRQACGVRCRGRSMRPATTSRRGSGASAGGPGERGDLAAGSAATWLHRVRASLVPWSSLWRRLQASWSGRRGRSSVGRRSVPVDTGRHVLIQPDRHAGRHLFDGTRPRRRRPRRTATRHDAGSAAPTRGTVRPRDGRDPGRAALRVQRRRRARGDPRWRTRRVPAARRRQLCLGPAPRLTGPAATLRLPHGSPAVVIVGRFDVLVTPASNASAQRRATRRPSARRRRPRPRPAPWRPRRRGRTTRST